MRLVTIIVGVMVGIVPAAAATVSIEGKDAVYFLHLPGTDATCEVETLGNTDVTEASCALGKYYIVATNEWGCGDSLGPAYCGSVKPGSSPPVANELTCEKGGRYFLFAGSGEVRCKNYDGGKRCESFDGSSFAEAACESGCRKTAGAGGCCRTGTRGCPPGIDKHDTK